MVEPSATLRRAVARLLASDPWRLSITGEFDAGLAELKEPGDGVPPAAVLLGVPAHPTIHSDELLAALRQPEHLRTAVVLFAHAATPEVFDWVARRPRAALLLWDDYTEGLEAVRRLLVPADSAPVEQPAADDIRVLFVDDSRTVRSSFKRMLARHGYVVEVAANAGEAFELARTRPFDIAIVDYHMPGENGDALCRRLRDDAATAGTRRRSSRAPTTSR